LIFCQSFRQISEEKMIWYISNSNFRRDFWKIDRLFC
jgi:hypothetical protein